jgi:hypothetical protein
VSTRVSFAPVAWPGVAEALGFTRTAVDGRYARAGLVLAPEGEWLALADRRPGTGELTPDLGSPGLWRVVPEGNAWVWIHELPLLGGVGADGAESAPTHDALAAFLDWALATREGRPPERWSPPERDEVLSWLAPGRLVARAGASVARGELVLGPDRLALVFGGLGRVPRALSPTRRAWLFALLTDVRRRWRLVRVGIDAATDAVVAEIDLTGVPLPWARSLVQLSLAVLVRTVEWMLVPLSFVLDAGAASLALERPFTTNQESSS